MRHMSGSHFVAYTIPSDGLRLDIALVETDRLLLHEETIPESLEQLLEEIERDGVLRSPVIVDRESLVVLDGMHRVEALRSIGCRFTCVCLVDYQSREIKVDRWCRVTRRTVRIEELKEKFSELDTYKISLRKSDVRGGADFLLMLNDGFYRMVSSESGILPALEIMAIIESWLRERGDKVGYETELDAEEMLKKGEVGFVLCPPRIEKHHVLDIISKGKVFTFKATRHIVPARPFGVNIPLEMLKDTEITVKEANRRLSQLLERKALKRVLPGQVWRGRRYEETVYVFEDV
ncbi:MAG: ParB N-terminal domain-containing protein [Candidatus Bathyarchaeota archaeon]|nr:MAG: ParB N-terminal domain-containing protein [Candidatus Bathyarchaeota archaeon]